MSNKDNPSSIIYRDTDSVYTMNPTSTNETMTIHHRLTGDKKYGAILQRSSSSIRLDVVGIPHIWIEFDPECFSTENKMFVCKGRFCQGACSWSLSAKCNISSVLCIDSEKHQVIKILDHGMLVASLSLN